MVHGLIEGIKCSTAAPLCSLRSETRREHSQKAVCIYPPASMTDETPCGLQLIHLGSMRSTLDRSVLMSAALEANPHEAQSGAWAMQRHIQQRGGVWGLQGWTCGADSKGKLLYCWSFVKKRVLENPQAPKAFALSLAGDPRYDKSDEPGFSRPQVPRMPSAAPYDTIASLPGCDRITSSKTSVLDERATVDYAAQSGIMSAC
ncbi:uncharacterized protein BDR25DRAFT_379274 [Lindgomyces ingoldianus]|uniref:Uncharacterized protein n=1 Tax=Lindgomyces ingoldianus TaxID=673940 RepID=A0ACB6R9C4_9PLEO|nr:uncharacterized protein BDR25DRAFT_379274 [Lindgomyces ingoldianus]KAF2475751.1 hypothetical protein BDR25DRAFT_379274 [Lindgomyces ingoldianus]